MKILNAREIAERMTNKQYKVLKKGIDVLYKEAKAGCKLFVGDIKNICLMEAKGKKSVAKAALEAHYKPTIKTRYDIQIAKADADYSMAIEQCDDKFGDDKDYCIKEARADKAHQIACARAQMAASRAEVMSNEKSAGRVNRESRD